MTREDILSGLRNAIARGENPSEAAITFLNAGYSEDDVKGALNLLTMEKVEKLNIPSKMLLSREIAPAAKKTPEPQKELPLLPEIGVQKKKQRTWLVFLIFAVIVSLLGALSAWLLLRAQQ